MAEPAGSRTDRRRVRAAPQARVWSGRRLGHPALLPKVWYPLALMGVADPQFLWIRTAYGLVRVHRRDVEVRGA